MSENKKSFPGDALAYSEEYLPGDGVYDDGEQLRAAVIGSEKVDPKSMEMTIEAAGNTVPRIERGDIVIGEVTYIRDQFASVKILAVRGKEDRVMHQMVEGTLHVSKADQGYVDDLQKLYCAGDLIRAKVIGTRGGPQLVTDRPEFGCVKARSKDGHIMKKKGHKVEDPVTGRIENRKLANDYGSGEI